MRTTIANRWMRSTCGSIAMYMALMIPVLTGAIGGAIDVAETYLVQERLSRALDAAALAVAGSTTLETQADMLARVNTFMNANYPAEKIGTAYNIQLTENGDSITVSAQADYDTTFLRFLGFNTLGVHASSTVQKEVQGVEVAMVLDISGSMNNNGKIDALKEAAKTLVDMVVQDNQGEYYSKVAIVPYAVAVNVGSYADKVRGVVAGPPVNITGATKANPVVVTAASHGFSNGQTVYIVGVKGMTQINNLQFTVASATTNTFALSGIDGRNYSTYKPGGTVGRICTTPGCEYIKFSNTSNQTKIFEKSTCVSERTGTFAYTDDPPTTAYVGTNYPAPTNTCLTSQIVPLTNNKTLLENSIDALVATGSTGGQVGIEWGWYILAPTFGYLWPTASRPADYNTEHLHKIAVLMTDGEYNSPYCQGVISKDATSGSGSTTDHINCNATNGDAYAQGKKLCDAMKKQDKNIEIYTIGFQVDDYPTGKSMMQYCATDSSHFYTAQTGDDLVDVFKDIAKKVTQIHISQ